MKKTLITAMVALGTAFAASAVTLEDADYSTLNTAAITASGVDLTGLASAKTTGFTLTFTLDEATLAELFSGNRTNKHMYSLATMAAGDNKLSVCTSLSGGTNVGLGLSLSEARNSYYSTYSSYHALSGDLSDNTTLSGYLDADGFTNDIVSAAVTYTYIYDGSNASNPASMVYLTYLKADGSYSTLSGSNNNFKSSTFGSPTNLKLNTELVSSVYVFDERVDAATATSLNLAAIKAIPEPATATLSLLALAGLAARRRRK